jgi:pyridoxal 5'-phosphate synthase pdxT subunit
MGSKPRIGVLAVQGAVAEHDQALADVGAVTVRVRDAAGLVDLDGLVIPGGETTTLRRMAGDSGLIDALRAARRGGLPILGTCAGLIALADDILDGDPTLVGGLDIVVRRNAYGRQVASFETQLAIDGIGAGPVEAVFIRAPVIERVGEGVRVHAIHQGRPVAVSDGPLLGLSFHPELTPDRRFHEWLVGRARAYARGSSEHTKEGLGVGA